MAHEGYTLAQSLFNTLCENIKIDGTVSVIFVR